MMVAFYTRYWMLYISTVSYSRKLTLIYKIVKKFKVPNKKKDLEKIVDCR